MTPDEVLLLVLLGGLTLYALMGGADFGAGVWEFNTALQATPRERAFLYRAIGPIWEANHVWLIFVLVGLFVGFPVAFAALCRALWLPFLLALAGIVFRGAGFVFHAYGEDPSRARPAWSAVFALASTLAPFFLSASAWAIASGRLEIGADGTFSGSHATGWLNPMSIFGAFFGVAVCAYLASVYLVRDAWRERERALMDLWRRRAIATGVWMGILSAAGLALVMTEAPELWASFAKRSWPLVAASVGAGVVSLAALVLRRPTLAAFSAAGAVAAVIWGWGLAQFPAIVPPRLTAAGTRAPDAVLDAVSIAIGGGFVLLAPALVLLLRLFKAGRPRD